MEINVHVVLVDINDISNSDVTNKRERGREGGREVCVCEWSE